MRNFQYWKKCQDFISRSIECELYLVVKHEGSSPGKTGFKMLVNHKTQYGTIGGGIMEVNLIKKGQKMLESQPETKIEKIKQIHRKSAEEQEQSGLICAGSQTVLRIHLTNTDQHWIDDIVRSYEMNTPKTLQISPNNIVLLPTQGENKYSFVESKNHFVYSETVGMMNRVYIFGGGHVGKAISRILATLDFYLIINDNRPDLDLLEKNTFVHEKQIADYPSLGEKVPEGENIYVIITTFGFDNDFEVLKEVISKNVRYIGLMGSSAKLNKIFRLARELGIEQKLLDKVHAPIGLDIPNETAEEIAIAIAAELIKVKNS